MENSGLLFSDRIVNFWILGVIGVGVFGLTAIGICLYHHSGGTKSTRQIFRDGLIGYFMPLIIVVRLVRKLLKGKSF